MRSRKFLRKQNREKYENISILKRPTKYPEQQNEGGKKEDKQRSYAKSLRNFRILGIKNQSPNLPKYVWGGKQGHWQMYQKNGICVFNNTSNNNTICMHSWQIQRQKTKQNKPRPQNLSCLQTFTVWIVDHSINKFTKTFIILQTYQLLFS